MTRLRDHPAIVAAGQALAEARAERDLLAATQGPRAVAEAAWPHRCLDEDLDIGQRRYEALQAEARARMRDPAQGPA